MAHPTLTLVNVITDGGRSELDIPLPCDMAREVIENLTTGREMAIEYRRDAEFNAQATHYLYFPNAGRGAVCDGADSQWTDCSSMDDLLDLTSSYDDHQCD